MPSAAIGEVREYLSEKPLHDGARVHIDPDGDVSHPRVAQNRKIDIPKQTARRFIVAAFDEYSDPVSAADHGNGGLPRTDDGYRKFRVFLPRQRVFDAAYKLRGGFKCPRKRVGGENTLTNIAERRINEQFAKRRFFPEKPFVILLYRVFENEMCRRKRLNDGSALLFRSSRSADDLRQKRKRFFVSWKSEEYSSESAARTPTSVTSGKSSPFVIICVPRRTSYS